MRKLILSATAAALTIAALPIALHGAQAPLSFSLPGLGDGPAMDLARRGRGADDPAGAKRRGRGTDDPVGHG